ncbi:MAG TPA: sigma 54-interacting transcriptional regulator [Gemmatimonadaceae bacterium]|nr:sigma 54-interacting transcriptional regulator [Gemmatimonadaceae bacterium]
MRALQRSFSEEALGFGIESIIGQSKPVRDALELVRKVAASRLTTVLLVGETGTGKELFARGIHYAGTSHAEPFVAVNCAAIPETLLESELFGHERGAFTGARSQKRGLMELAGEGTLFLDEIGELPPRLQPKLLRVLQERRVRRLGGLEEIPINCRIVTAANTALHDAVSRLEFREDLYYRLNVFRVNLPPLRDRLEDLQPLAEHFLEELGRQQGLEPKRLTPDAVALLRTHSWPGNIRELKNVIEHAAILSEENAIRADHIVIQQRSAQAAARSPVGEIVIPPEGKTLEEIEHEAVQLTMRLTRGNQSAAARILGISRPTLARKLRPRVSATNGTTP